MSTSRRAYDLLRAFVNQEKEAFASRQNSFDGSAASELEEAIAKPWTIQKQTPAKGPTSLPAADPKGRARIVLGVAETDDFGAIHRRYESLMKRSDPENFPAGSEERFTAERIRRLVVDAYRLLSDAVDETERRFGSLEIE